MFNTEFQSGVPEVVPEIGDRISAGRFVRGVLRLQGSEIHHYYKHDNTNSRGTGPYRFLKSLMCTSHHHFITIMYDFQQISMYIYLKLNEVQ